MGDAEQLPPVADQPTDATTTESTQEQKPDDLEAILARHRKELRDLQSRVTQKKKNATKKTRKKVNEECAELERGLKGRHEAELAQVTGDGGDAEPEPVSEPEEDGGKDEVETVTERVEEMRVTPPPSPPPPPPPQQQQQQQQQQQPGKKRNRQKERLARRQAEVEAASARAQEEASRMTDHGAVEKAHVDGVLKREGLEEVEVRADGHCLFAAVGDQLFRRGVTEELLDYREVRRRAAEYMDRNRDDFEPFVDLESQSWEEYLRKIRDTSAWGGQPELLALARVFGVGITVVQVPRNEVINREGGEKMLWVVYYWKGSNSGRHYNSLKSVS